jgi:hypothetical protein
LRRAVTLTEWNPIIAFLVSVVVGLLFSVLVLLAGFVAAAQLAGFRTSGGGHVRHLSLISLDKFRLFRFYPHLFPQERKEREVHQR